ncbi:hypothetical protein [Alkalihalobacillus sp. BA299]|uniref:hypothetical protein n=1 Tax=Alkalihalobacillus sp. BA299 TaxID=2815938 RepID=UPI001ADD0203|nr:hypothetical protein [Alkalihalobacillus sp. BA299]
MYKKYLFIPIFLIVLSITLPTNTHASKENEDKLIFKPFTLVQKEFVDLNGNGKKEAVELYAEKNQYDLARAWKLVVDGKEVKKFVDMYDLYQLGNMKFNDVMNDQTEEILLYFQSVGSGGITGLNIFKEKDHKFFEVFTDPNSKDWYKESLERFEMKYLGDYKVSFYDKQTGLSAIIPLSEERYKTYPDKKKLQELLESIDTRIDPVSGYEFKTISPGKPQEIITTQLVWGIAHVDGIAYFKTIYVFDPTEYKYKPTKVALYSTETDELLAEKPIK